MKNTTPLYATANEILDFFNRGNIGVRKNIELFTKTNPDWEHRLDIGKLISDCQKLVSAGIMIELSSGQTLFDRCFHTVNYSSPGIEYGEYNFIVNGFESIIEEMGPSVLPVIVEKDNGDEDIGTCFLVGNSNTIYTARHVVENMNRVKILGPDNKKLPIFSIHVSKNDLIDIAIINTHIPQNIRPFRVSAEPKILSEILSIGYPPIPGFEAFRIYDISHVNSNLKFSKGIVNGKSHSYLDKQDLILFNARVKGGNSGGPIINNRGYVVGMLVQIPISTEDTSRIDELGYGIAVTTKSLIDALHFPSEGRKLNLTEIEDGEYCTI